MIEVRSEDRSKALTSTLEGLDKRFGRGAVMRLGEQPAQRVSVVSTGSFTLDDLLGIGGWPKGRVVEIYGPEASGKTTLALHAVAEVQARGGTAAFVDAEHALDVIYAGKLGVDTESLLVSQPDSGEQALEIAEALVRSGAVDLLVVDSVAALVPQAELEGQMGDPHMGLQARLMSQALRKLTAITNRTGATVIFLNQVRQKIGVVFGNAETTPGGNALKFYASIRLEVRRIGAITSGQEQVGARTRLKVVKNKLAPPFRNAEVEIMYGRGICRAGEILSAAEERGVIERSGSWFAFGEERLGQGKENVRDRLVAEPELLARVLAALREVEGEAEPGGEAAEA
ncbi:MAG: recombinase RecA [Alphaproteobacteria bacterium]|nr:recombinase RecA [Alphaproteobacteria bacterium]